VNLSITTTHKEGPVVGARSMPGNPYDGQTLAEALEQAAILSDVNPEVEIVDRGYKGVALDGVKIYHPGLKRGITRGLRAMMRSRSAIEPAIGYMKTDGRLARNWLKGALGDAPHGIACGAGHNLRMIVRKLRFFLRPYAGHAAALGCSRVTLEIRPLATKTNCSGPTIELCDRLKDGRREIRSASDVTDKSIDNWHLAAIPDQTRFD
jgi:IS5 family transposase